MSHEVIAQVILKKADGTSILDTVEPMTAQTIGKYKPGDREFEEASTNLEALGFAVVSKGPVGLTISGEKILFESVFHTKLQQHEAEEKMIEATLYSASTPFIIPKELSHLIAEVSLPSPPQLFP